MFLVGVWQTQNGFTEALRQAFRAHRDYEWNPDRQRSKIHIYHDFPLEPMRFPAIVVRFGGGPALLRGIGDEFSTVDTSDASIQGATYSRVTAERFSGQMRPTINLSVFARSAYDRANIADWILLFIRTFSTDKFTSEGVQIEDINVGNGTIMELGADPVYTIPIDIRCLTSWERVVPEAEVHTLRGICITGVFSILPNGATEA